MRFGPRAESRPIQKIIVTLTFVMFRRARDPVSAGSPVRMVSGAGHHRRHGEYHYGNHPVAGHRFAQIHSEPLHLTDNAVIGKGF
jgi:hypothetical protein